MNAIVNLLNSLFGFFLSVILIIILAIVLGFWGISIQRAQATNNYQVDTSKLQTLSTDNAKLYKSKE
ncbi:MAG: DUF4006 family protein [Helicobacter sp.]|nr:DUF4006 family protein [Helicobacter sp.]